MEAARVEIIHHLPGRLRVRVPEVKSDAAFATSLEQRLRSVRGVRAAQANPLTGSVLVHYDRARSRSVFGALNSMAAVSTSALTPVSKPVLSRQTDLAPVIGRIVLQKALETAIEVAVRKSVLLLIAAVL